MTAIETGLQDLKRQHPEWEPWLAVVQEVLSETNNLEWDAIVPIRSEAQQSKVPLLAGTTLSLEKRSIRRLLEKLVLIAHRGGTAKMATLEPALHRDLDQTRPSRGHTGRQLRQPRVRHRRGNPGCSVHPVRLDGRSTAQPHVRDDPTGTA